MTAPTSRVPVPGTSPSAPTTAPTDFGAPITTTAPTTDTPKPSPQPSTPKAPAPATPATPGDAPMISPRNMPPDAETKAANTDADADWTVLSEGAPEVPEKPTPPAVDIGPGMSNGEMQKRTQAAHNDPDYRAAMDEYNAAVIKRDRYDAALKRFEDHSQTDQTGALGDGKPITISQYDAAYMQRMLRRIDETDPKGIDAFEKLKNDDSPSGKRLWASVQRSMQLTSDDKVTSNGRPPMTGSINNLPASLRTYTKTDFSKPPGDGPDRSGATVFQQQKQYSEASRIAALIKGTDPKYLNGSQLNKGVAKVGLQALSRSAESVDGDTSASELEYVTETTAPFLEALKNDEQSVAALLTGPDGKKYTKSLLGFRWTDDGAAAANVLPDADPNNKFAARTMSVIANELSGGGSKKEAREAWDRYCNLKGSDGVSIGKNSPLLVRAIGASMTPFIPDITGGKGHPEFTAPWAEPTVANGSYPGATAIFAIINTDEDAGKKFTAHALIEQQNSVTAYAKEHGSPNAGSHLRRAGAIAGLIEMGTYIAAVDEPGSTARAKAYERRSSSYDYAVDVLGVAGLDKPVNAITLGGDKLKAVLIGESPDIDRAFKPDAPPNTAIAHQVLTEMDSIPPDLVKKYPWAVDANGKIKPMGEVISSAEDQNLNKEDASNAVDQMFAAIAGNDKALFNERYTTVVDYNWDQ